MGRLIPSCDWASSPLGPLDRWPQSLRTALGIILRSPVPMVLLWGEDGIMLYNDAYSVLAGGCHPGLLGSKVREGWPELSDFNDNVMKVGLAGGMLSYRDQQLTIHRNGVPEQVWMDLSYSPVPDESGRPVGVIAIVVETTERVLADRRKAAKRERLVQMFEQAPGIIAMTEGPEHVFVLSNAATRTLTGRDDMVGKTVREAHPELKGQGILEMLDRAYTTGKPCRGEAVPVQLNRRPGEPAEERFIDIICQPVFGEDGRVSGIFIEGSDVTERVLADKRLRGSEEFSRRVLASSEGCIQLLDLEGRLESISEGG
ncbi:PAS domain-containing protein [Siccirubricoccus deserti]|uniref:PAS domain-containing protein n=1 Tax=Siccirubricoccus deserti TaxID=2013562 RepID=A0A9X0R5I9_9PROT|nr:PAS domain-containing protein [Siccirubricoccus deserti]MBC4019350.1 PAS domain-containing protein [Siccirubricoccus deserti]